MKKYCSHFERNPHVSIKTIRYYNCHTELFAIIGSYCDTNGSHDLNILPPLAFQCMDTVHEKHLNNKDTKNTKSLTEIII